MLKIAEELCGFEVSSSQVSRITAELDEQLGAWRNRPLGVCPYLLLDARYEKVRQGGKVVNWAVLIAIGIEVLSKRSVLGMSVSLSEAEVRWREFLASLQERGLHSVQMITTDDHLGLRVSLDARFRGVTWRRCQFHLQRNALADVQRNSMRPEVAHDLRSIFNSPNLAEAQRLQEFVVKKGRSSAPALAQWIEENVGQRLTVFALPAEHRRRLRPTNANERVNLEIRRRTHVATLFPNEAYLHRLVTALLSEISDDWESGRVYLTREAR